MTGSENTSRRARRAADKGGASEEIKDRNKKLREQAAAKRRGKRRQERGVAGGEGLDAQERMDDALTRGTHATTKFVRNNFAWIQWVVVAAIVGSMALLIWEYRKEQDRQKAGDQLADALGATFGRLTTAEARPVRGGEVVDTRPEFGSREEQTQAELKRWGELKSLDQPALELLAALGKARALYDAGDYGDAASAYEAVTQEPILDRFERLRMQALEGWALALEGAKKPQAALKALGRMSNAADEYGQQLAKYHEARIRYSLGERDQALKLLTELDAKLGKAAGPGGPRDYLGAAVRDLLKTVDPSRIEPPNPLTGMMPDLSQLTPEQRAQLQMLLQQQQQQAPASEPQGPLRPEEDPAEESAPNEAEDVPSGPKPQPTAPAPQPTTAPQPESQPKPATQPTTAPQPAPAAPPATAPGAAPESE